MMTVFNMTRDINGYNGFGLPPSNTMINSTLLAGVEQHFTVPETGSALYKNVLAIFSVDPGNSVWVAFNNTAALPGGSFAAVTSELNPASRLVKPGDVISCITSDTSDSVGVSFYATT